MGGMLAATFLAIFFVPMFFRLIFDRKLTESRSREALHEEIDHARELRKRLPVATPGHPPTPDAGGAVPPPAAETGGPHA